MPDKEQNLIRRLKDLQEGVHDINETLHAINISIKKEKITNHTREMIVTMLPDNPESQQPPHRLHEAKTMIEELFSETTNEQLLIRFRYYFEEVQNVYVNEILRINANLTAIKESKLQKLNKWWQDCNVDEREIGHEAIAKLLNGDNVAKILAKADNNTRIRLLSCAFEAVKDAKLEANRQSEAWKKLSRAEQNIALQTVQKVSGQSANIWWQKATLQERNRLLGKILMTLVDTQQKKPNQKKEKIG